MVKPIRTSYPVSFRINFKEDQMAKIREAAEVRGCPAADIIRDGAFDRAKRIVNDARRVKPE